MTKDDTLFSIRYAVRVLERHARFWRNIDNLVRVMALLAGSAAFAALSAGNQALGLWLLVGFAIMQSVEYGIRPADHAASAMAARRGYAKLYAGSSSLGESDLETAYSALVADDEIVVPDVLRRLAYNDVLHERGRDPAYLYSETKWMRIISVVA